MNCLMFLYANRIHCGLTWTMENGTQDQEGGVTERLWSSSKNHGTYFDFRINRSINGDRSDNTDNSMTATPSTLVVTMHGDVVTAAFRRRGRNAYNNEIIHTDRDGNCEFQPSTATNGRQGDATSVWLDKKEANPSVSPKTGSDANPSAVDRCRFRTTTPRQCHSFGSLRPRVTLSTSVGLGSKSSEKCSV
jgi:hypothetical protein